MIRIIPLGKQGFAPLVGLAFLLFVIAALSLIHVPTAYGKETKQKRFSSPEEAVNAMVDALKAHDRNALIAIYGPGNADLVNSGDEVDDRLQRERFLKAYDEKNRVGTVGDRKALLYVGNEDWPFSIPIVKKGKSWVFDTRAGRREMIDRRIGRNELNVIQVCLAYADAQREFALRDLDRDGLFEYAQKFLSDPGQKNGLYWDALEGEEPSPLGPAMAAARAEGYSPPKTGENVPYHGYYYKILFAQGKNAPGGAFDYVVNGKMLGGFAMVAYPAKYGNSGIMTFMVNQNGIVYQKNLGKDTEKIARRIEKYDPDKTWQKIE